MLEQEKSWKVIRHHGLKVPVEPMCRPLLRYTWGIKALECPE